ncbi:haloacid dehalogenase type II [Halorarius litoreus]|uniref:haloacid dehalogenase type II n=1 Tax=Halorarius litoreus TaxID=2962676 RepID=UPI0020CC6814|nr:haloacid dehalogenase type II [Halorarius litoreus]
MSFDPDRIETITVDSYGTLVDPYATVAKLGEYVDASRVERIAVEWRARSIMYTMVGNAIGFYQPFYEMNRDALSYAAAANGQELTDQDIADILSVYHELDVFPDVRDGLDRLVDGGYDVYVVSNGNPEMLDSMVEHADIGGLVSDTISADEVQTFKPAPEIYRHAAARVGTPIDRVCHVAGPSFDVLGCTNAGMQSTWLNREGGPWEAFAGDCPGFEAATFHDLADELGV